MEQKHNHWLAWVILALAIVLVAVLGVTYPRQMAPPIAEPAAMVPLPTATVAVGNRYGRFDSVQIDDDLRANTAAFAGLVEFDGEAIFADDATMSGDLDVTGDATIGGDIDVTGVCIWSDDTVITSSLTMGVGAAADTDITFNGAAQDYYVGLDDGTDDLLIGLGGTVGTTPIISMDENKDVVLAHDLAVANDTALTGDLTVAGSIAGLMPVLGKAANYAVLAADTGSVISVTGNITLTLPAAAVGLNYCIYNFGGGDLTLDPVDVTDTVLILTNGAGQRVTNTTAGDQLCLVATSATNWIGLERVGTWADGD